MNKDQVKGTIDDVAGRAKRQVGEWTGDTNAQMEGLGQQVKGKAEKAWGNTKDAVRDGQAQAKEQAGKVKEQAGKAWDNTKSAVHDGKEHAKEQAGKVKEQAANAWDKTKDAAHTEKAEAERRQQAERMSEEDELEPAHAGKTVTPTH
jgi:uncharacterized protein YjbJ (UPF0337 family)